MHCKCLCKVKSPDPLCLHANKKRKGMFQLWNDNDMKRKKETGSNCSPILFIIYIFFFIGFLAGALTSHFFKTSLYAPILGLYQTLLSQLQALEIDSSALFLLAAKKHLKYFLLLCFFSCTNIWKYYYRLFLIYCGFQNGLLFSFCLIMNGFSGIVGYVCFLLPQTLLLAPSYIIAICHCGLLQESLTRDSFSQTKKQMILHQLPSLLVSIALLLLGCLLEGFLNPSMLRLFFRE